MYTIEIFYNGGWHVHDTAEHYAEAAAIAKAVSESIGDVPGVIVTIEPHD